MHFSYYNFTTGVLFQKGFDFWHGKKMNRLKGLILLALASSVMHITVRRIRVKAIHCWHKQESCREESHINHPWLLTATWLLNFHLLCTVLISHQIKNVPCCVIFSSLCLVLSKFWTLKLFFKKQNNSCLWHIKVLVLTSTSSNISWSRGMGLYWVFLFFSTKVVYM